MMNCYGIEVTIAWEILKSVSTTAILTFNNEGGVCLHSHGEVVNSPFTYFLNESLHTHNPIISWYLSRGGYPELQYVWHLGELKIFTKVPTSKKQDKITLIGFVSISIEDALKQFTLGLDLKILPNSGEYTTDKWWEFTLAQIDHMVGAIIMRTQISHQQRKIISCIGRLKSASPSFIDLDTMSGDVKTIASQLRTLKIKGFVDNITKGRNSFYQISDTRLASYFHSVYYTETVKGDPNFIWIF